ncbi:quinol:cytochrome C oxidoreductase [Blastopirellula sp. JC732]|uniref:Quinol:cytochrome C oxidoreductase n=1 Tax=Blastopirellula sediminis TaxID=2894196 RepID=A0A9X1MLC7_9BACT|nr:quinol:cytochrome C oxidoreductase [Blastopirellula sediminis]MCC9608888.1 quinol:cytochrome C oxidoreductase [Blastopirellula sediminis]MCC9628335.1 quinol:cytochrome C oxidoreductase [Blastopirellula sediminis]
MGHHQKQIKVSNDETIRLGDIRSVLMVGGYGAGLAGMLVALVMGIMAGDRLRHFFFAYLTNYLFFLSIALGALGFIALQHLTRAGWSASVRRITEIIAMTLAPMALLFLPILFSVLSGSHSLYEWNNSELVATNHVLAGKAPYLNSTFFAIRAVLYFAVWIAAARFFFAKSTAQDESGDPSLTLRMESKSPLVVAAFALTVTFASIDWAMSLDPMWFSTMYGVYFFAGAMVAFFSFTLICCSVLQSWGKLTEVITVERYHDLSKFIWGFTLFWGYIAFSQYLLYWYGNIPEETGWYLVRQNDAWRNVSLLLLFGMFIIPFLGTMGRAVRRNRALMVAWAIFLLVMHWVDIFWLVMPQYSPDKLPFGPMEIACLIGLGGFFIGNLAWIAAERPLLAFRDPRLTESLTLENM